MLNKKILIEDYKPTIPEDNEDDEEKNLINTPFGMFRVNDSMNPIRQFNLKMVNTNFPITPKIKMLLDDLEGIEVFFPITRYKFIIGIGKVFNTKEVEDSIKNILIDSNEIIIYQDNELNKNLNELIDKIGKSNKYWIIYAFPNGNLDYSCEDTMNTHKLYKESQVYSKGKIIVSEKLQEKLKNETDK